MFMPTLAVSLTAVGALALLAIVDWFVSGFWVAVPYHRPGEERPDDVRNRNADGEPDEFKAVA
jgi:hypothetical protein